MVTIKNQRQGLNSPSKGKKKYKKPKHFTLENFSLRFPKLSEGIFQQVDNQTLVRCKKVNRNWHKIIKDHRIYWIKRINKLSAKFHEFKEN